MTLQLLVAVHLKFTSVIKMLKIKSRELRLLSSQVEQFLDTVYSVYSYSKK